MLSLFKNDLKQLKDFFVIYIGCLVLNFIISGLSYNQDIAVITFYLIVFVFTLIIPTINLRHLFSEAKETYYNSLPLTRLQSFMIHYLSGIICLIVPVIIYCVLLQGDFLKNSLALLLIILLYYTLSNLSAYLTTTLFMHIVLQMVIIFVPIVLYFSLSLVYASFIKGVVYDGMSLDMISSLMPFIRIAAAASVDLELNYFIYIGYLVVSFLLTLYICKNRDRSNNYQGFTYKIVAQIIRLIIIISGSWLLASLLGVSSASIKTFVIINIIATVIVTFIIQFIHFKRIKYQLCIIQSALIVFVTVVVFAGSKNYLENYIPDAVDAVVIDQDAAGVKSDIRITDDQEIAKVSKIHQELIESSRVDDLPRKINITYYCSNGSKVVRRYSVEHTEYEKIVNEIDKNLIKSWNGKYYQLLEKMDKCQKIEFFNNENYIIDSKDELQLLKEILQRKLTDFENDPSLLKNVVSGEEFWCNVNFKNSSSMYYYNTNDPMFLALADFNKIKAN